MTIPLTTVPFSITERWNYSFKTSPYAPQLLTSSETNVDKVSFKTTSINKLLWSRKLSWLFFRSKFPRNFLDSPVILDSPKYFFDRKFSFENICAKKSFLVNIFWILFHPNQQENIVGNFGFSWTFLTFYFITPDLRKRYVVCGENNQIFSKS